MIKTKSKKGLNSTNNFHLYLYRLKICICRNSVCVCVCLLQSNLMCLFLFDRVPQKHTPLYVILYVVAATHSLHFTFWIHLALQHRYYIVQRCILFILHKTNLYIKKQNFFSFNTGYTTCKHKKALFGILRVKQLKSLHYSSSFMSFVYLCMS